MVAVGKALVLMFSTQNNKIGTQDAIYKYNNLQYMLINSLIYQPEFISEIGSTVQEDDFNNPKLREIYHVLKSLATESPDGVVYPSKIDSKLKEDFQTALQNEDINLFITTVIDSPTELAEKLKEASVKERLKLALAENSQTLENESSNTLDVLAGLMSVLKDSRERLIYEKKTAGEIAQQIYNEMVEEKEKQKSTVVETPFPTLNSYINGGFRGGQLIVLAAKTGVGKTTLACNIMTQALKNGQSVLYFTFEMQQAEILKRVMSSYAGIPLRKFDQGGAYNDPQVQAELQKILPVINTWKMHINDQYLTMGQIEQISLNQKEQADGLDLIVIDYLQLINEDYTLRNKTRQEIIATFSRACKKLAKQLNVPVIILSQVRRKDTLVPFKVSTQGQTNDTNDIDPNKPTKEDLRGSTAIANDSDIVLILSRNTNKEAITKTATLTIDKHRNGQTDVDIKLDALLEINLFVDQNTTQSQPDGYNSEDVAVPEQDNNGMCNEFFYNPDEDDDDSAFNYPPFSE